MINKKLILAAILVLAAFLRLYQLTTLPALNADEAAIGYNAYSLLKTGKDEHGNPWPIHFQSFNDYKPGLYFYLVLPFIKLLGLTELAVRLPGALLGVATVFMVYLLVGELFPRRKHYSLFAIHYSLAEIAALFLAISPWHLHFSRGGWEVNVATFFITLGLWAFIKGLKQDKWWYISVLSFVASLYTYHAARIVVPLLGVGLLAWALRRNLVSKYQTKHVLLGGLVGVLFLIPLALDFLGPAGVSRAAGVGLFADTGPFWRTNEQRGEHKDFRSPLAVVLHNKPINYGLSFLENYSDHFWGEFLFLSGDEIQRNRVPEMGQMYLVSLPLVVFGLISIAKSPGGWVPILFWLLVSPLAAALTFQAPHALRAQNMVVPLVVISAYGALNLWQWIGSLKIPRAATVILLYGFMVVYAWDFTRYLHQYYVHMAKTYDFSSQYGVKELVQYVKENEGKYQKVVVTDRYDQPYILFLFYMQYPPEKFQGAHELTARDQFAFSTVREFDKFVFRGIKPWDEIRTQFPNALIAGTDEEIPDEANILETIYFPSGRIAFQVVAN